MQNPEVPPVGIRGTLAVETPEGKRGRINMPKPAAHVTEVDVHEHSITMRTG